VWVRFPPSALVVERNASTRAPALPDEGNAEGNAPSPALPPRAAGFDTVTGYGEGVTELAEIEYEDGVTEIPTVPFYVVAKNTLYSGLAKQAVFDVFPAASRAEAELVATTARDPLISMTNVRIVETAPKPGPDRVLVVRSPARVRDWADMATP
jgi:hypothetical protein